MKDLEELEVNLLKVEQQSLATIRKQFLRKHMPVAQKLLILTLAYDLGFIPDHIYNPQFFGLIEKEGERENDWRGRDALFDLSKVLKLSV